MTALTALAALLNRHDSFDPATQATLRRMIAPAIARADAEFDGICETISQRRSWLDQHRADDPPHALYEKRRARFWAVDSKAHAEAGELLDRAYRVLTLADCEAA